MNRVPIRLILKRGLKRRCPRCGQGELFKRWIETHDRCAVCNLQFLRNHGDIWMFVIITDRIPIGIGVIAVFFGYQSTNHLFAVAFFVALAIPMMATMRQRQGLAIALDYLWRIYMPDPSDEIHRTGYLISADGEPHPREADRAP